MTMSFSRLRRCSSPSGPTFLHLSAWPRNMLELALPGLFDCACLVIRFDIMCSNSSVYWHSNLVSSSHRQNMLAHTCTYSSKWSVFKGATLTNASIRYHGFFIRLIGVLISMNSGFQSGHPGNLSYKKELNHKTGRWLKHFPRESVHGS